MLVKFLRSKMCDTEKKCTSWSREVSGYVEKPCSDFYADLLGDLKCLRWIELFWEPPAGVERPNRTHDNYSIALGEAPGYENSPQIRLYKGKTFLESFNTKCFDSDTQQRLCERVQSTGADRFKILVYLACRNLLLPCNLPAGANANIEQRGPRFEVINTWKILPGRGWTVQEDRRSILSRRILIKPAGSLKGTGDLKGFDIQTLLMFMDFFED